MGFFAALASALYLAGKSSSMTSDARIMDKMVVEQWKRDNCSTAACFVKRNDIYIEYRKLIHDEYDRLKGFADEHGWFDRTIPMGKVPKEYRETVPMLLAYYHDATSFAERPMEIRAEYTILAPKYRLFDLKSDPCLEGLCEYWGSVAGTSYYRERSKWIKNNPNATRCLKLKSAFEPMPGYFTRDTSQSEAEYQSLLAIFKKQDEGNALK